MDRDKEDKVPLMVRLPESLHAQINDLAAARMTSLNNLCIQACLEFVERQGQTRIDDVALVLRAVGVDEEKITRAIAALKSR